MAPRMPLLSVVVPIYNVAAYLEPCLDSIAAQTFGELEVLLVNDGSTDGSRDLAEDYTRRDERFKLIDRPNGGLSAARNTGIERAGGEFLAFVDSDDILPPNAYELLMGSLEKTGSDFATGKVLRLTSAGTSRARWLSETFRETRLKTHITRFRPLLADRIAWNKVFRRSFWDAHDLRFPEGRINEDIPVILPLHFSARSVDVISEPVYLWRFRDTGELSITEQRAEKRALLQRLAAVSDVHDYLADHGPRNAKRWYDETLVADDLKYYLNVLDVANDEYRELFLERVNALLDRADDDVYDALPAIERLKWHLVRRRLMPQVLRVLDFQRSELADRPPVRVGRHWLGDYPFRNDPELKIPDSVYRLDQELSVAAHIDVVRLERERLRIEGRVYIEGIGAAQAGDQRVGLALLRPGRLRRLRYLTSAVRLKTESVHRPDANARSRERLSDISWSGFTATLDPRKLRRRSRWRPGTWELYVTVKAGGVRRARKVFAFDDLSSPSCVDLPSPDEVLVRAAPTERGELVVGIASRWAAIHSHRAGDDWFELSGEARGISADGLKLELAAEGGKPRRRFPATVTDGPAHGFTARVPLSALAPLAEPSTGSAATDDYDDDVIVPSLELFLVDGSGRVRIGLRDGTRLARSLATTNGREVALLGGRNGDASLCLRRPPAVLSGARWNADGTLAVEGQSAGAEPIDLVVFSPERLVQHAFRTEAHGSGRFSCAAAPAAVRSLAGALPLSEGRWLLCTRPAAETGQSAPTAAAVGAELAASLPLVAVVRHKRFTLACGPDGDAVLRVSRDLDDDERGPFQQRRLIRTAYAGRRAEPLREAVVYSSFHGRQYSDSPRAIHEELVRRARRWSTCGSSGTGLRGARHGDGCCATAAASITRRSRGARYVVVNDHFPDWFERRADQICVQTWHGTPLKRLGFDVLRSARHVAQLRAALEQAGRATGSTSCRRTASPRPILRGRTRLEGEILETGYPRDDVLAGVDRDDRHAPRSASGSASPTASASCCTRRPTATTCSTSAGATGSTCSSTSARCARRSATDTVLLFRKHHYIVDDVTGRPPTASCATSRATPTAPS